MKNDYIWERSITRKKYGTNPIKADTVFTISRYYKSHAYYQFLYLKAHCALTQLNKDDTIKIKRDQINRIPVFVNKKGDTSMLKLSFQNETRNIELNED